MYFKGPKPAIKCAQHVTCYRRQNHPCDCGTHWQTPKNEFEYPPLSEFEYPAPRSNFGPLAGHEHNRSTESLGGSSAAIGGQNSLRQAFLFGLTRPNSRRRPHAIVRTLLVGHTDPPFRAVSVSLSVGTGSRGGPCTLQYTVLVPRRAATLSARMMESERDRERRQGGN